MELASIREAGDSILAEESEVSTCLSEHFLVEKHFFVKKLQDMDLDVCSLI